MDQVDALQLYFEGEAAHKAGRNDQCLEMWDRVLQFLADNGLHALETDMATLPRAMLAMNLAIVCQKAKRYADMMYVTGLGGLVALLPFYLIETAWVTPFEPTAKQHLSWPYSRAKPVYSPAGRVPYCFSAP